MVYCPNCAAPIDSVKFCRSCGANVSLVPQALTGELSKIVEDDSHRGRRRKKKSPTIESAASDFFIGIGFLFIALAIWHFFPGGATWWFWMLIPAFACMGRGIGQYLQLKSEQQRFAPPISPPVSAPQIEAPTSSGLTPPSSITEHTTRHLDPSPERKHERG